MNSLTLPMILSGPIVRKAEPTEITIWIATSKSYRIHGKLYRTTSINNATSFDYQLFHSKCETDSIRMGKKLFVHLIKLSPYLKELFQQILYRL